MKTSRRSPPRDRLYFCLEIDQFSAQVCAAYNPPHRARPFVVVRQDAESHRSTVWASSIPAREMGIRPGMPVLEVRKKHSGVEVVHRDRALEETACDDLSEILVGYTPEYEIGETGTCLLNLSGVPLLRRLDPEQLALKLQDEIAYKTGLTEVAVGISGKKLLSRMLARIAIPNGIQRCPAGGEDELLASLEADLLPGLSGVCREKIRKYGLRKIGQIRHLGRGALTRRMGREGERLYSMATGMDSRCADNTPQSVRAETVLDRDINDTSQLVQNVRLTADKLCHKMKTWNFQAESLTFVLTYADHRVVRKAAHFPFPTNDLATIAPVAVRVFEELYQRRVAIKSIRLNVNRTGADTGQLSLFETDADRKQRHLDDALIDVRNRMGFHSILSASYLEVG